MPMWREEKGGVLERQWKVPGERKKKSQEEKKQHKTLLCMVCKMLPYNAFGWGEEDFIKSSPDLLLSKAVLLRFTVV